MVPTKMTKEEFAALLNGREYLSEITKAEIDLAIKSRLVVIYAQSDDLVELRGIINDEFGVYEFIDLNVSKGLKIMWVREDYDELVGEGWTPPAAAFKVVVEHCPDDFEGQWLVKSEAPSASFDIMEDGELFCRGLVIDVGQWMEDK